MKTQLISAVLVAVSAAVTSPAFARDNNAPITRAEVRAELVQLEKAGYQPWRANGPHYPDTIQTALARIHENDAVANDVTASGYGSDAGNTSQAGSKHVIRPAEQSIYAHN